MNCITKTVSILAKGDYESAIKEYAKALQINPNYAEAYNNRGNAYFEQGKQ